MLSAASEGGERFGDDDDDCRGGRTTDGSSSSVSAADSSAASTAASLERVKAGRLTGVSGMTGAGRERPARTGLARGFIATVGSREMEEVERSNAPSEVDLTGACAKGDMPTPLSLGRACLLMRPADMNAA